MYGFVVFVSFVVRHSRDRDRLTSNLTETCRVHRGSNQSGLGVQNHLHRHRFEHRLERRLVAEGTHEGAGGQRRQDLRRDAAADVDAAGRDRSQREVAGFGAVGFDEHVQRFHAGGAAAVDRGE